jgi:hypothetical protein
MPIEHLPWFRRSLLRARPDTLWVFGDNLAHKGRGGQAKECRGEPNAVGIPTKRRPSRDEDAYFVDSDFARAKPEIDAAFIRLADHLRTGGTVVLPAQGIGTGRAELERRAPRIHRYVQRCVARLHEIAPPADDCRDSDDKGEAPPRPR